MNTEEPVLWLYQNNNKKITTLGEINKKEEWYLLTAT